MKEGTKHTLGILFKFGVILIIIVMVIMIKVDETEGDYDNFCWGKGFKEATDYKFDYEGGVSIECDKKHIFPDLYCTEETYCKDSRLDKWGDCRVELSRMRCGER